MTTDERVIIHPELPETEWRLLRARARKARNDAIVADDGPIPYWLDPEDYIYVLGGRLLRLDGARQVRYRASLVKNRTSPREDSLKSEFSEPPPQQGPVGPAETEGWR